MSLRQPDAFDSQAQKSKEADRCGQRWVCGSEGFVINASDMVQCSMQA